MTVPVPATRYAAPLALPLAVLFVFALTAPCQATTQPVRHSDDEAAAVDLLTRAMRAAKATAYRGVQQVQAWTGGRTCAQTLHVSGVPGRGTYVRTGGSTVARGGADGSDTRPNLLTDNYTVLRAGMAKVAGRWADVVDARASRRVHARYWLDRATGLMLRRDVFDGTGELARRSWFSEIRFDGTPQAPPQTDPAPSASGRQTVLPLGAAGGLRADGWTVPAMLAPGFALYDIRRTGAGADRALHLSYSDGISTVSVFEQRGHLEESRLTGWHHARVGGRTVYVRDTIPRQLMWAGPGTVFTVVADAPDQAVAGTVRALPAAEERPGLWARFVRGLGRIVSWCNPF